MPTARITPLAQWQRARYATKTPPDPLPYKQFPPSERRKPSNKPEPVVTTSTPKKQSFVHRLFSLRSEDPSPYKNEPRDIARGIEASQRVVREGVLDPRYRPASRKVVALICALPFAIFLSVELFQRRFMGKEQKVRPVRRVELEPGTQTENAPP